MRTLHIIAVAGFLALFTGCASTTDVDQAARQMADLQDQINELKKQVSSKEDVARLNAKVAEQTDQLVRSSSEMTIKVGQMDERLQNAQGNVEQTNYRIDRMVQQLTQVQRDVEALKAAAGASGGQPATGEVTVSPASGENPVEIYQSAYRDYQRGNFDLAIQGFRDYVSRSPASDLADNSSYWIGEALFSQKKYREAIQQFDLMASQYPKSDKVAGALLKKGYSYLEIGQKSQGIVQLQYVVHEFPTSSEASLARQKLKALGIETN